MEKWTLSAITDKKSDGQTQVAEISQEIHKEYTH